VNRIPNIIDFADHSTKSNDLGSAGPLLEELPAASIHYTDLSRDRQLLRAWITP
jgi:hypothetical protein